ncbi:hypothetical protein MSAN_02077900 [Mycena sanguinolenta]|uniref:Uncharacterized protein n=1 Tax=Mycena sanguinolenta TaxID=230812 RepID=A0A8H7CKD5_9AGAR|nr:hypothetical protein MSAN_02077900 [Mycena sanguinolenta]
MANIFLTTVKPPASPPRFKPNSPSHWPNIPAPGFTASPWRQLFQWAVARCGTTTSSAPLSPPAPTLRPPSICPLGTVVPAAP